MSTIPPNLVGSILQTPFAQHQASSVRDAERTQHAAAQRQQIAAATETDTTVETTDNDTQVHTDSEGQGSQGRAFSEPEENPPAAPEPSEPQEGHFLDLEA